MKNDKNLYVGNGATEIGIDGVQNKMTISMPPGMRELTCEEKTQISGGSGLSFWLGFGLGYISDGFKSLF